MCRVCRVSGWGGAGAQLLDGADEFLQLLDVLSCVAGKLATVGVVGAD